MTWLDVALAVTVYTVILAAYSFTILALLWRPTDRQLADAYSQVRSALRRLLKL